MDQIGIDSQIAERRGVEIGDRAVRIDYFDVRHRPETAAVVETGEMREAVEVLTFNLAPRRRAAAAGNDAVGIRRSRNSCDRANSQRLA
jgi:hypothetical protein